jgi:hypothetical protein
MYALMAPRRLSTPGVEGLLGRHLSTMSEPSAWLTITPVDMATGAATGSMGLEPPFDSRWPAELASDAASVADFIKGGLTQYTPAQRQAAIADARAIVLNAALPATERVEALGKLPQTPETRDDAVVAAAVELATLAPGLRVSIWRAMYGVENPYLIEPLLNALVYDTADHRRRAAASALGTFIAESRVKAALEQAQASDPSQAVREAAQQALLSEEELDQLALQELLDERLSAQERLAAMSQRALPVFALNATTCSLLRCRGWGKNPCSGVGAGEQLPKSSPAGVVDRSDSVSAVPRQLAAGGSGRDPAERIRRIELPMHGPPAPKCPINA